MSKQRPLLVLFLLAIIFPLMTWGQKADRILIFTKTRGYAHASIPAGVEAMQEIAAKRNIQVDTTSNVEWFTSEKLKPYAALVFISTNGSVLNEEQREAFKEYIHSGGGFMGVHGASAGARTWPWYQEMVGGAFSSHPEPKEGVLLRGNLLHPINRDFPEHMVWKDEWYNFSQVEEGLTILLWADEASYIGGEYGKNHPIAWIRDFEGGRSFYTALGHFSYHFTDAIFRKHLEAGLLYAMGKDAETASF
ncbi:ThuA domain-containing protein [Muricauda sp. HICW]|uniref:ThuA domain-containing protein n=1 Tax=Flagellimonas chongwuensis TaxID=2697365 RepID=A0A850NL72_9FLAO|nr:ThuA domain-containing protein [Allomuricauda chongwuensis]NVN19048.1 ThuA domain-containing protein [Allomuricauda chongwuensis]